ncbi:ABC transporter permease, partial [Streptomyces parvus]|nr:ABC transporter permease [Streptomyces parvus]
MTDLLPTARTGGGPAVLTKSTAPPPDPPQDPGPRV